ncbi:apoptotic chromatin condensation inducer in the nucleus [Anaeramoeba flamelloides]|uniref:Apoptotic chromatin condensation inducer in the nucleus n=1 Tax=Anaeramoeba flamelloides TaxID=1746091 RepID=A0AAV7ZUV4_9EUKA|nr:apoptotic chromatin condensation inducer in the nucleus [Anaeramoeba flamelloides]
MNYFTGEDSDTLLQSTNCSVFIPEQFSGDILQDFEHKPRTSVLQSEILHFYLVLSTTLQEEKERTNWQKMVCETYASIAIVSQKVSFQNLNLITAVKTKVKNSQIDSIRELPRINSSGTFLKNGDIVIPSQIEIAYNSKKRNGALEDQILLKIELKTEKKAISELKFTNLIKEGKTDKQKKKKEREFPTNKVINFGFDPQLDVNQLFEQLSEIPMVFKKTFFLNIPIIFPLKYRCTHQFIGNSNFITVTLENLHEKEPIVINSIQILLNSTKKVSNSTKLKQDHKEIANSNSNSTATNNSNGNSYAQEKEKTNLKKVKKDAINELIIKQQEQKEKRAKKERETGKIIKKEIEKEKVKEKNVSNPNKQYTKKEKGTEKEKKRVKKEINKSNEQPANKNKNSPKIKNKNKNSPKIKNSPKVKNSPKKKNLTNHNIPKKKNLKNKMNQNETQSNEKAKNLKKSKINKNLRSLSFKKKNNEKKNQKQNSNNSLNQIIQEKGFKTLTQTQTQSRNLGLQPTRQLKLDEKFNIIHLSETLFQNGKSVIIEPKEEINFLFKIEKKNTQLGKVDYIFGRFRSIVYTMWKLQFQNQLIPKQIPIEWALERESSIQISIHPIENEIIVNRKFSLKIELENKSNIHSELRLRTPFVHRTAVEGKQKKILKNKKKNGKPNNSDGDENAVNNNPEEEEKQEKQEKQENGDEDDDQDETAMIVFEKSSLINIKPKSSIIVNLSLLPLKIGFLEFNIILNDLNSGGILILDKTCLIYVKNDFEK